MNEGCEAGRFCAGQISVKGLQTVEAVAVLGARALIHGVLKGEGWQKWKAESESQEVRCSTAWLLPEPQLVFLPKGNRSK